MYDLPNAMQIDHVRGGGVGRLTVKHPDDVVIVMAMRTPLCKARKGGYKDMSSDELMLATFKAARKRMGPIDPAIVEDITVGTVLTPGAPYRARAASLAAGFPDTTAVQTINRFCSSGLMAVSVIANGIRNKEIECGLAVGFESMTAKCVPVFGVRALLFALLTGLASPDRGVGDGFSEEIMANQQSADCMQPMGWTSENVAQDFNISREAMDEYAAKSHTRAERARADGSFKDEMCVGSSSSVKSTG